MYGNEKVRPKTNTFFRVQISKACLYVLLLSLPRGIKNPIRLSSDRKLFLLGFCILL